MTPNLTTNSTNAMVVLETSRQVASMLQSGLVNMAATTLHRLRQECNLTYDMVMLRLPVYIHADDLANVAELVDTLSE